MAFGWKIVPLAWDLVTSRVRMQALHLTSIHQFQRARRLRNEARARALCCPAYLGDNMNLCRVLGRYKMYVDTRDGGIAPHLLLDGYWEMWVTETLVELVHEGMVVGDIGANLGYFSLVMADLVGATGMVHAFEPNPRMVQLLERTVAVNGFHARIAVHQIALGNQNDREIALVVPPNEPKNAHIVPINDDLPGDAVRVPMHRLDSRPDWSTIELLKVDVEGAEELVWAGAQGLLDNGCLKTVILEFTAARYADPTGFLLRLLAPGFDLARIDFVAGIVDATIEDVLGRDPHQDIMLVLRRK